jgi:cell division protein FtsQ
MPKLKLRNDFLNKVYKSDEFNRRRKSRKKQLQKQKLRLSFVFFVIIALSVLAVLSFTVFFPIKIITTKGSNYYTNSQIIDASRIDIGDNLLAVSKDKTLEKMRKKLPFVQNIEFERILPDSLHIKVTDAVEYRCYKVGEKYYTVGKDGWVLESYSEKPKDIIVITCNKVKCEVGAPIELNEKYSREAISPIIKNLEKYGITVNELDLSDRINITAKINDRFTVVFGNGADIDPKIKHLNTMLQSIPENKSGKIDLSVWSQENPQAIFVAKNEK